MVSDAYRRFAAWAATIEWGCVGVIVFTVAFWAIVVILLLDS